MQRTSCNDDPETMEFAPYGSEKYKKPAVTAKRLAAQRCLVPNEAPTGWNLAGKSADRVTIEARALGLSYGRYCAACNGGYIIRMLSDMGIENGLSIIDKAWKSFGRQQKRRKK